MLILNRLGTRPARSPDSRRPAGDDVSLLVLDDATLLRLADAAPINPLPAPTISTRQRSTRPRQVTRWIRSDRNTDEKAPRTAGALALSLKVSF